MTSRTYLRRAGSVPSLLARRWQSTASSPSRFTVYGSGSQNELVQHMKTHAGHDATGHDGLVVLASRSYARWLTNPDFMAQFLSTVSDTTQEISVVAAAVDGLIPQTPFTRARHGLSVCRGSAHHLLPELQSGGDSGRNTDANAALFVKMGHLGGDAAASRNPVTVTLPLANTIFQNNRKSTLLTSRWRRPSPDAPLALQHMTSTQTQTINCSALSSSVDVHLPVGPVTAPRLIAAGLGNIVRQIDVDGTPTPASRELETAVTQVYDRWAARGHPLQGPLSVWALVTPPSAAADDARTDALRAWQADMAGRDTMASELQATAQAGSHLVPLLQRGARIYRVLSGGGGWGKKAGLLSLEPDTKFALPGAEDDLDSFMRSFAGEHDAHGADVVAPGSLIQYFVQPLLEEQAATAGEEHFSTGAVFGATRWFGEDPAESGKGWTTVPNVFGGLSEQGVYLSDAPVAGGEGMVETKISVPDTFVVARS